MTERTPAKAVQPLALGRWGMLFLMALGVLIAFVDRTSISSALASPAFKHHFQLSDVGRGWVGAAFFWSYGLAQAPMGWVVDRYGVKVPYTICFVIWCAATAATGLMTTIPELIAMRVVVGAAEAVVIPATYRWIRNHFDETQSGTTTGIVAMGNKFGPAVGAPIAAWLIVQYDWRMMFFVTGAIGLLWLLPWITGAKNDFPKSGELRIKQREAASVSLASILASPLVWGTMVLNFCYNYFTFYCMTWMPSYLVEQRGLSLERSGLFTFFSFAGIAVVAVLGGMLADWLIARGGNAVAVRKWFTTAGFLGGCTVLLGANAASLDEALFWNVASLSMLGLATANVLALCRLTLIPRPAVGLVTGIQQVAVSLAGGAAAALSGWLLHVGGSYQLPMMIIFVFLVIGAATTWILLKPEYAPKVAAEPSRAE